MIEISRFQSPIGPLSIIAVKEGVVKIAFLNESDEKMKKWCLIHFGTTPKEGTDSTTKAKCQILNYLAGSRKPLDFPVLHLNSPFRKRVLEVQRKIPYGQTRSYGEVAEMVNSPKAYRAVGSANAENPLPLYFPCHRIIKTNGELGRFGGGLKIKEFLLDLEQQKV